MLLSLYICLSIFYFPSVICAYCLKSQCLCQSKFLASIPFFYLTHLLCIYPFISFSFLSCVITKKKKCNILTLVIHKNSHHLHFFYLPGYIEREKEVLFLQASSVYTQVLRMSDYSVLSSSLAVNIFLVCCLLLRPVRFHVFFLFPSVSLCSTSPLTVPVFVYLSCSSLHFTWLSPQAIIIKR